jgi:hypothetical protein
VLDGWRPGKLAIGQQVQIAYSAKHPEKAELTSQL